MQAKINESGELTIVHLMGHVDYESVDPFRETCVKRFSGKKLIFNLKGLSFVGSTGITPFIQVIEEIAISSPNGIKLCQVGSEFKKMIIAQEIRGVEIYEEQMHAEHSYYRPPVAELVPSVVDEMSVKPKEPVVIQENRPWDYIK